MDGNGEDRGVEYLIFPPNLLLPGLGNVKFGRGGVTPDIYRFSTHSSSHATELLIQYLRQKSSETH